MHSHFRHHGVRQIKTFLGVELPEHGRKTTWVLRWLYAMRSKEAWEMCHPTRVAKALKAVAQKKMGPDNAKQNYKM